MLTSLFDIPLVFIMGYLTFFGLSIHTIFNILPIKLIVQLVFHDLIALSIEFVILFLSTFLFNHLLDVSKVVYVEIVLLVIEL